MLRLAQEAVRLRDHASFLAASFYPPALRSSYLALRAFNVELAALPESVSNAQLGRIRMQWWRQAVDDAFKGKPPNHPVALGIAFAASRAKLSRQHFERLLDAREANLLSPSFPTMANLSQYGQATQGALLALQLELLLSARGSDGLDLDAVNHAVSHAGLAIALATLLHSMPFHASKRVSIVPAEVASANGLVEEALYRQGGTADGARGAAHDLAGAAQAELDSARTALGLPSKRIEKSLMPVFLAVTPARAYLDRLAKVDYDAFSPSLQLKTWTLPLQMWRDDWRRRF